MLVPIVFYLPIKNGKARNSHGSGTDTQCLLQYQCLEKRWSLVNSCLSCEKHKRSPYIVWLRWFQTWNIMKYLFVSICSNGYIMAMSSFFEPLWTYDHSLCRGPRMMTPPGNHFRVVPPGFLLSVRGGEAKGTGCGGFPMDHYRLATWFRAPSEHQELQWVEPRNVLPKTPPSP